jgi:hypothetical protein
MRFTLSNTPGSTSAELAMLNKARSIIIDAGILAILPENQNKPDRELMETRGSAGGWVADHVRSITLTFLKRSSTGAQAAR